MFIVSVDDPSLDPNKMYLREKKERLNFN